MVDLLLETTGVIREPRRIAALALTLCGKLAKLDGPDLALVVTHHDVQRLVAHLGLCSKQFRMSK